MGGVPQCVEMVICCCELQAEIADPHLTHYGATVARVLWLHTCVRMRISNMQDWVGTGRVDQTSSADILCESNRTTTTERVDVHRERWKVRWVTAPYNVIIWVIWPTLNAQDNCDRDNLCNVCQLRNTRRSDAKMWHSAANCFTISCMSFCCVLPDNYWKLSEDIIFHSRIIKGLIKNDNSRS